MQEAEGEYFSMERMRQRCPLLFDEHMGTAEPASDSPRQGAARHGTASARRGSSGDAAAAAAAAGAITESQVGGRTGDEGHGRGAGPSARLMHAMDASVHDGWLRQARAEQVCARVHVFRFVHVAHEAHLRDLLHATNA